MSDYGGLVLELAISIDTTGSMSPCRVELRKKLKDLIVRTQGMLHGVRIRIALLFHGDYCDASIRGSYVIRYQDFEESIDRLLAFIDATGNTNGGDAEECYELAAWTASQKLSWSEGSRKLFILVGDDEAHLPSYPQNTAHLDIFEQVAALKEQGVRTVALQCLAYRGKAKFWAKVADVGAGQHITLHQFRALDLVITGLFFQEASPDMFDAYVRSAAEEEKFDDPTARIFESISGRKVPEEFRRPVGFRMPHAETPRASRIARTGTIDPSTFTAMDPSRFQQFRTDERTKMKPFILERLARFEPWASFYKLVKSETLRPNREVILRDERTGAWYRGLEIREALGFPKDREMSICPSDVPDGYAAFVQSTSHTRILDARSEVLYEMPESDSRA